MQASTAVLPPPTTTVPAGQVLSRDAEAARFRQARAEENRVEIGENFIGAQVFADLGARDDVAAQAEQQAQLLGGGLGAHFVLGHTVGVQAARERALLEQRDRVAEPAQVDRARDSGRARPHDRDALAVVLACLERQLASSVDGVGRETLEARDRDRLLAPIMVHAAALAQHLDGAHPRAGVAERVGLQYRLAGAERIVGRDLAYEARYVDAGRAGFDAGRVVAVQAARGLDARRLARERRLQLLEIFAPDGSGRCGSHVAKAILAYFNRRKRGGAGYGRSGAAARTPAIRGSGCTPNSRTPTTATAMPP